MADDEKVNQESQESKQLLKKFPKPGRQNLLLVFGSLLVVLTGIGTGWVLSGRARQGDVKTAVSDVAPGGQLTQLEAGIEDEEAFPDTAEGVLEEGGIEGEGTYHLVREGGPSRYVYLTSTVIDIQGFVGKTVKVWGETLSAQSAGWLMDVGRIKVLE
jgi:hypothetical protein